MLSNRGMKEALGNLIDGTCYQVCMLGGGGMLLGVHAGWGGYATRCACWVGGACYQVCMLGGGGMLPGVHAGWVGGMHPDVVGLGGRMKAEPIPVVAARGSRRGGGLGPWAHHSTP